MKMPNNQSPLIKCQKSNILSRRDSRNATAERHGYSHMNETSRPHNDGNSSNSTEPHSFKNESFALKTSAEKNYTTHPQASSVKHDHHTDSGDHSKPQSLGSSIPDQTSKDTHSDGAVIDYSAWNSSSPPPSNSSGTSATPSSRVKEFIHSSQTFSNNPGNNTLISNSTSNDFPAAISTNSSSPVQLQPLTSDQLHRNTSHDKIKVWCIGLGSLIAFICIGTAVLLAKKRRKLQAPAAFLRRHFRSNSSDSHMAVRDRSSIGPRFRTSDPFSSPSTFSRKPLVLRPESLSYIRSSSPRRPSLLHLRNQSLKSQISQPIIEPPSPAYSQPTYVDSPEKAVRSTSSSCTQPSSQFTVSPPSYHQPRDHPTFLSKHSSSLSFTRDPGTRRGTVFPTKASHIASRLVEDNSGPLTERTPVPPRPPRPDCSLLPSSAVVTGVSSQTIEESEPVFPTILPLRVSRRPQCINKPNRRHNSIDQVILDPPATYAFQDSPTLPQFHRGERNSVLSISRGADPGRVSHLSRSTCYSQSSEQETHLVPEGSVNPDHENHSTVRFMSFGTSRTSAKLQQQLDSFISSHMQNDSNLI